MQRNVRRIVLLLLVTVAGWQGGRAARAARVEYRIFTMPRSIPVRPADADALGLRVIEFRTIDGGMLRGWYVPSKTGAAVLIAGGTSATRASMLPYARLLAAGGTGALLFDWPGCGESDGKIGIGVKEREAVKAAMRYLARQPDVDAHRLGVLGFSMGAHVSLLEAADDSLVRALIIEGGFESPWQQGMAEYRSSGIATQLGGLFGDWLAGMEIHTPDAAAAAARFSPRPLLVVAGTADETVPAALSREVFEHAREPKSFWLIHGADHGGYLRADTTYANRLRDFVERALTHGSN